MWASYEGLVQVSGMIHNRDLISNSKFQHIPEAHKFRLKFEFGTYDYLLAAHVAENLRAQTWGNDMKDLFSRVGE